MLDAWRLMGNTMDWAALPIVCEMYGIDDPAVFIAELAAVREYVQRVNQ